MESDFKEYPKTLDPDDFWGQVKRTVHGNPVSEDQIQMIVNAIQSSLGLAKGDSLLDLGCGNGALSHRLFSMISSFLGVDFSNYLISVAKKNFEAPPDFCFEMADAAEYVAKEESPERFTKALCYGCFSYFEKSNAEFILSTLESRFRNISVIFIGNLPDKDRLENFYHTPPKSTGELDDHDSKIGIWRTMDEFYRLASRNGWNARFKTMHESFYAAHYRYDVVLNRRP